ncbi:MAG: tripartite tricarboxylate transporter TctB family protein [Dehalobacterium sp.]
MSNKKLLPRCILHNAGERSIDSLINFKKIPWGELAVPIFAICYVIYTLGYQFINNFKEATINYSLFLSIPMVISLCPILIKIFSQLSDKEEKAVNGGYKKVLLFLFITIAMVALINFLGYILAFLVYLICSFWLMGTRSVPKILVISAGVVIFISLVFDMWLKLPLPIGIFKGLL